MEIRTKRITIENVKSGKCFLKSGKVYMKTSGCGGTRSCYCVNLENGNLVEFSSCLYVAPFDCRLVEN